MEDFTGKNITLLGILLNSMLFIAKFLVGIISNSLAVTSDAINSLNDVITSIMIFFAVKLGNKKADKTHPFGHHRIEPLAGVIVAIFAGILGFEIVKRAISGFFAPQQVHFTAIVAIVLLCSMLVKAAMAYLFLSTAKRLRSPAIKAEGVDSRDDIFVTSIALLGLIGSSLGFPYLDNIVALGIGIYIFYECYRLARENIDYLMGHSPSHNHMRQIERVAKDVGGVLGIRYGRAHYVGNFLHIELHIKVDRELSIEKASKIRDKVRHRLERLEDIDHAFVNIEPA